jgi:hypothetical protein
VHSAIHLMPFPSSDNLHQTTPLKFIGVGGEEIGRASSE